MTALANTEELLANLQSKAAGLDGYGEVEFEDAVRDVWVRIMAALEGLSEASKGQEITVEHLDKWYTWALELLVRAVEEERNG